MPQLFTPAALLAAGTGAASTVANAIGPGGQPVAAIPTPQMDPSAFQLGGQTSQEADWNAKIAAAQQPADAAKQKLDQVKQLIDVAQNGADWGTKAQAVGALQQLGYSSLDDAKGSEAGLEGDYARKQNALDQTKVQLGPKPPSRAEQEYGQFTQQAQAAQGRTGAIADLSQYNQDRSASNALAQGRGQEALDLYRNYATGNGPTAAQGQLQSGLSQSNALAASIAANARGGGGNLALANLQAQQVQAQNTAQATRDAAMLRAQEQQAGLAGYANQVAAQRALELQQMGLDATQAQAQAQREMQQRQLNDTRSQQMAQNALGVQSTQLGANMAYQGGSAANALAAGQTNAQIATGNRGASYMKFGDTLGALQAGVSATGQAARI